MQSGAGGKSRPSRRPFGPRPHQKEPGNPKRSDSSPGRHEADHDVTPWAYDKQYESAESTLRGSPNPSNPPNRHRPSPLRPRNRFNDVRRPLPSTTAIKGETHDIPFLFSSRSSHFANIRAPDPTKDPFPSQNGLPSDAPVWKNYMAEAQRWGTDTVGNWNQSMDVILIFAGLFSAILTAFLIEFYHQLQPDSQEILTSQLATITQILQLGFSGQNVTTLGLHAESGASSLGPSKTAIGVNILWFISLTCSLGAAVGAMVIKQWLQFYTLGLSPNAYEYAHQHQYRLNALLAWHVPSIISALPFIMLASVGLFLVGLGLQLIQLNTLVAALVIGVMTIVLSCYVLSLALSLMYPACPYKTSALFLMQSLGRRIRSILPPSFKKRKHLQRSVFPRETVEASEISEIRNQQSQLVVDSITWLLGVSQEEETIQNALLSVAKLSHTEDMIQKLLSTNALEQLVQRASVPLPPLGHTFWNHLDGILPSHSIFERFSRAQIYMQTLISVWHHPSYLSSKRPPAISEKHNMERVGSEDFNKVIQIDNTTQPQDSQYVCLLGDWLLFWRLLKHQHGNKIINLANKGYDLNIYINVICIEVYHYHLQKDVVPLYMPQNRGAFIDLHEMLQVIYDEGQAHLSIENQSFWLLLDTLAYVFSGIDDAPIELQGLPRTWFSPSQSPSLMRKETILLIVKLLDANRMQYNLISKKLLLCLQMLLPVPMVASSRRTFFLQVQQESPSEGELFEQMNMTLEGLINVFIPQLTLRSSSGLPPEDISKQELHTKIGSLALAQLINSILKTNYPTTHHNSLFLNLPSKYVDNVLTHLLSLQWTNEMEGQVSWLHNLLTEWYASGAISDSSSIHKCVTILQRTLVPDWSDSDLQIVLKKMFNFLGELWKDPDPFFGNLVCISLCEILDQSFKMGTQNKKVLRQFLEMHALMAVGVFLISDECIEECSLKWFNLCQEWERDLDVSKYTPSAQEVYQFTSLKKAAKQ